jgi:hypothetical protein
MPSVAGGLHHGSVRGEVLGTDVATGLVCQEELIERFVEASFGHGAMPGVHVLGG